jgi:hypothetical protein
MNPKLRYFNKCGNEKVRLQNESNSNFGKVVNKQNPAGFENMPG